MQSLLRCFVSLACRQMAIIGISFLAILGGNSGPSSLATNASDRLVFEPPAGTPAERHVVLVAGDEEYRTEESMPMLAKILSQKHRFRCTVIFAMGPDGADYIDPNHSAGIRGFDALANADLMIIGTRFRNPSAEQAKFIGDFLNAGKPVIGTRTATHAFQGKGDFAGLPYNDFGLKVLGETWVSHHGEHKSQGARAVFEPKSLIHPLLRGVKPFFAPSDVYGVIHLSEEDEILARGAVTESLDPMSVAVSGGVNAPMQPLAWMHRYDRPNGKGTGLSFCTTAGASVDFVDANLRRMIVNACYYLTGREVPGLADVGYVDPFYPSFYGFINDKDYWKQTNLKPADLGLGKAPKLADPPHSPSWPFRDAPPVAAKEKLPLDFAEGSRIVMVGGSLAERMNLFGHFETLLQTRFASKNLIFRNFAWPGDEVARQQRPENYTKLDDPLQVFGPDILLCFFGANERFAGGTDEAIAAFRGRYKAWIDKTKTKYHRDGKDLRFVLVSPIAVEKTANPLLPQAEAANQDLAKYSAAVKQVAEELGLPFVDLFEPSRALFGSSQDVYTINGMHLNEEGDRVISEMLDKQLFAKPHPKTMGPSELERIRSAINDKSWYHMQDYRMLNGWYVYGGRRTWDTETFPREYVKIRNMVKVRDQYIWDLVAGKQVADKPDDSQTGDLYVPETMFGTRDEAFRKGREPETLVYPTPEETIATMKVPEGFEVQLFASEREFPELANPTQIAFDSKGRLWVACMINYPQWLPGQEKPGDKLLILEDTDHDGKADVCKTFYDKLICPTGFEFYQDGVLVVDQPRILFLKDSDGDDKADQVTQIIDGLASDDTHHTIGAWEYSHGGLIYMLEGVSMATAMETPWGPFRNYGSSGAYVFDPSSWKFKHFRTPGYGNPWCMVFDSWGQGVVGDGTGAQQHWVSPLAGYPVPSRRTLRENFDNQGMRPAIGSDFLTTRQFPDEVQGQFIYACVINMHGMPRFQVGDEPGTAGYAGKRIENLLESTDGFFRPIDPQLGPDGALWFGDWCNPLIGHMQYSQRDPNRGHTHGRMYRLVYTKKPLLEPVLQHGKSIEELLNQLTVYEPRTRYRARRELRARPKTDVLRAVEKWNAGVQDGNRLCEGLWLQESFRSLDEKLVNTLLKHEDFHVRAAVVNSVTNELERYPKALEVFRQAVADAHPRVRLEALRGLSFVQTAEAAELALQVLDRPMDYWLEYTMEHTLQALKPAVDIAEASGSFLANGNEKHRDYYQTYKLAAGPGGQAVRPLKIAEDAEAPQADREKAVQVLAGLGGGKSERGQVVFGRVCAACHQIGTVGKEFGPKLDDVAGRYAKVDILKHVLWPNEKIAKGYETIQVVTDEGETVTGFVLKETETAITLGTSNGKPEEILKSNIEGRKEMKASSMPEGLMKTIAPSEFLDLMEYLASQNRFVIQEGGWIETGVAEGPLRKHGEWQEISRDAQVQMGVNFPDNWKQFNNMVLSPADPNTREFAFHSPGEASESPAIAIRLAASSEIRHIEIQNRRNPQHYDRAKDLAVWISDDGVDWKRVWKAEKGAASWSIDLPAGTKGRYLKLGLDGKGIFHLNQVVIYGTR